jgi:hypothetical protein
VLSLIARGMSNTEISEHLQAVVFAYESGLVQPGE